MALIFVACFFPGCKGAPPKPVAVPAPPPPPAPPPKPRLARPPVAVTPPLTQELDPRLSRIDSVARQAIATGGFPGAVILVGHQGKIVYHKGFGYRSILPRRQPMTEDTIFDLASLTKVIATTTAVMQLVDEGRLGLDDPVGKYWPAFDRNGKRHITIRHLLTHCSGLRPEVNPRVRWQGYEGAIVAIADDYPVKTPGNSFKYSDANFIALGEIVHRVSGMPLNVYCQKKIFRPLGLRHTSFLPPAS
ncbi:MAG: serine hydrolase domain-containing protein, partial [Thermodesulfobacteriota bacterium]